MQGANSALIFRDDLTGFFNKRYLKHQELRFQSFQDTNIPYTLVMLDIDNFKDINDTYGHIKGDKVLRDFSAYLKKSLRKGDSIIRFGGDEFLFLMFNTELYDAEIVCERLIRNCSKKKFSGLEISISAGLASFPIDGKDFKVLVDKADKALYEAKRLGKNRLSRLNDKKIVIPSRIFVNRKAEKEILSNGMTTIHKSPAIYFVKGNIGMGKTRLVKEVLRSCRSREILWSNCISFLDEIPYFPIREMLKYKFRRRKEDIFRTIPDAYRTELGKLIPEVLIGMESNTKSEPSDLEGYRLYQSLLQVIMEGELPKVLVIDNMQWIDNASVAFISYMLRTMKNVDIKCIFIYREEEKTELIKDFSSYISREIPVREISLPPLGSASIKLMIKSIIGDVPPNNLVSYARKESGGNPFFLEELIRELFEKKFLQLKQETWCFSQPDMEIVPKSIEEIIQKKYMDIAEAERNMLELGAVMGRFDVTLFSLLMEKEEDTILKLLENIYNAGLIDEIGGKITFRQEITREVIYKRNINPFKKRRLHQRIGLILESIPGTRDPETLNELAFHFYYARNKEKGVKYSLKAAEFARQNMLLEEVKRFYSWADDLLGNTPYN